MMSEIVPQEIRTSQPKPEAKRHIKLHYARQPLPPLQKKAMVKNLLRLI